jgi:hypothetical protein
MSQGKEKVFGGVGASFPGKSSGVFKTRSRARPRVSKARPAEALGGHGSKSKLYHWLKNFPILTYVIQEKIAA